MSWNDIDENIRELIDTANSIPGVKTRWSCGGHDEVTYANQAQTGNWYIVFAEHHGAADILNQVESRLSKNISHIDASELSVLAPGSGASLLLLAIHIEPATYLAALREELDRAGITLQPVPYELTQMEPVDRQEFYKLGTAFFIGNLVRNFTGIYSGGFVGPTALSSWRK